LITITFSLTYFEIYFISVSFLSFTIYTYDKIQALKNSKNITRISENKLLFSSFIGGTIGSVLSMLLFWHKIKKPSFMIKFFLVVILQVVAIFLYIRGYMDILLSYININ